MHRHNKITPKNVFNEIRNDKCDCKTVRKDGSIH